MRTPASLEASRAVDSLAPLTRRRFIGSGLAAGLAAGGLALPGALRGQDGVAPSRRLAIGVIGLGRGLDHVKACLDIPGYEIAWLCDVDAERLARAADLVEKRAGARPRTAADLRRILDDRAVDAITIAACNHWHAPAAILGCAAGKHVYVEKPGSQNGREAELLVGAARKHGRVVQMGNQRRSWPGVIEGIAKLHAGAIGPVRYARCWYTNKRPSIGRGKPVAPPAHLDYDLWQGPAPERPYVDNLVHYNWHGRWHWGNGELGNNGVHALDVARWGLGVDTPRTVAYVGGRYSFDDDQETPDTGSALYDFGEVGASWEGSSCHPRRVEKPPFVTFYGDGGTLSIEGDGYVIQDLEGKETGKGSGPSGDKVHFVDFLAAVRDGKAANSRIDDAQKSAILCHLGNIAYRTARTLRIDPASGRIQGDKEAEKLWAREYRGGWEPIV